MNESILEVVELPFVKSKMAAMSWCYPWNPGRPLVFEVGYHPRKKIHVIRVVFQDQAMYSGSSFRGAKTCRIGKKGMFLVILTNFGKNMTDKLQKYMQKRIFRVYFHA